MNIVIDKEFQRLIPPLTDEEYAGLEESIMKDGCRDALVLWENILIDGHNRFRICTENNVPFRTVQKEFASREEKKDEVRQRNGAKNGNREDRITEVTKVRLCLFRQALCYGLLLNR